MRLSPVLVATLAFAVLLWGSPLCGATTTSSTVVTVAVTAGDDELPANISVWDQFPVVLSDQIEYSIAATLNSLASGTTTTPPPSSSDDSDGGLSWYVILGIAGGGLVLVAAVALLAMNGVMLNQKKGGTNQMQPPPAEYDQVPQNDGQMYRPPRPNSKVIQVVLTPPGRAGV